MNVNSFTETTNNLVKNVNIALASMQALNNSMTTDEDSVVISVEGTDPITGDASTYSYAIPSYNYSLNELRRISNTVDTFVNGNGVVLLNDGTYRQVSTIPVAKSPDRITNISSPSYFRVKSNWFFEDLIFPQIYVRFDLKDKIDDRSDRIIVKRIIFDNFDNTETQWFKDNFIGKTYLYPDTLDILNNNGKSYWEDEQTIDLPLLTRQYTGQFIITDKQIVNNVQWYYLNTINYGLVTDVSTVKNLELKVNDQLRFNNSIFKVNEINTSEKKVNLTPTIGLGSPAINQSFDIYSVPFGNKYADIAIGFNECNILFLKGVNDDFNIIADEWSDSISFYSNDLTLINNGTSLESYYYNYVSDFGKQMEGQAKEKFIPAFFGVVPSAPVLSSSQFTVSQINSHINAALDTNFIKNTQTEIENTKTIINSLKSTISQQKANLVELTDVASRLDLQSKIDTNTITLSKQTVQYESLVKSLSTLAYENNGVLNDPKYRVRGFFNIPDGVKATSNENEQLQEIIQFDIAYRYLRLDNTGSALNTYTYNDPSSGQQVTGTYSNWQIIQSPIKARSYDSSQGKYVWLEENIADGNAININQVDVPISKGEKVEIKIRSISEAGWPANPLKSDWSNSVIIEFPSNLADSNQLTNILTDAQVEQETIKLDQTLNSAGIYTHINDSVPNPNSANGTYFKHQSEFLAFNESVKNISNGITSELTTDLQSHLDDFNNKQYVTLTRPTDSSSAYPQITGTLQQFFQSIVNICPSIYDELQDLID